MVRGESDLRSATITVVESAELWGGDNRAETIFKRASTRRWVIQGVGPS